MLQFSLAGLEGKGRNHLLTILKPSMLYWVNSIIYFAHTHTHIYIYGGFHPINCKYLSNVCSYHNSRFRVGIANIHIAYYPGTMHKAPTM